MAYIGNSPVQDETVTSAQIVDGAIVDADVNSSAAIAFSKMANLTASRLLVSDGSGDVSVSNVTSAEALLLDGGTSATSTTLAAADRLIVNDNGTIVQVALSDFETFFEGAIDTLSSAMTFSSTVTVGSDGSGQDVIFYSGTSGDNLTWDSSEEKLTITGTNGQTALDVADGNLVVADNIDLEGDLDVDGTTNLDAVDIDGALTQDGGNVVFNEDSGDYDFRVESNGNANMLFVDGGNDRVAIGHNSPDGTLHVHTATAGSVTAPSTADDLVIEGSTTPGVSILMPNNGVGRYGFGVVEDNDRAYMSYSHDAEKMFFGVGGADRMTITAGNVGIGCSPSTTLHAVKDSDVDDASTGSIRAGNATDVSGYVSIGYDDSADAGFIQSIDEGVAYKPLILNKLGGNVGIGCTPASGYPLEILATSGNANLRVSATGSGQGARLFLRSHNTDSTYLSFNDSDDDTVLAQIRSYGTAHGTTAKRQGLALETAGTERLFIDSSGQVGIGGAAGAAYFHVHGDMDNTGSYGIRVEAAGSDGSNIGYMMVFVDEDNADVGSVTTSSSGNSTAFNTSSDYRLKENEVAISDGITKLNQLKPYKFNWKKSPDYVVDGFFAHEVQEIVPQAVVGEKDAVDKDGEIERQMIDHSKLVPLLVAAVKELSAKVEALENA